MTDTNTLSPEHCKCLDAVLESAAKTRKLIADCKACGLPMDDLEAENEAQAQLTAAIKAKFYPMRG